MSKIPGASSQEPDAGLPQLIADRYRVEARLTRGAMGEIFVAVDQTTGRRVALKRLLGAAQKNTALMLFEREYYTLASLKHPCIVEVYDYGVDGMPFYTMELLDGRDLSKVAPAPWRDACRHLRDVASSLALLHARHLLHRDVSPRNVRITAEGRCKLFDFGALTSFGLPEEVIGTPPGTPPEALYGVPLDQRLDLYGLGALGYWLLTGRHAYPTRDLRQLPELWAIPIASPSTLVRGIPEELDQLILSLLSQDRVERPSSAAEVMDRLGALAGLEPEEHPDVAESYLAIPRLVGRDVEIRRVKRNLSGAVGGEGGALLIEALAGMGKTRLVDDATIAGRILGMTVVRVDAELHANPFGIAIAVADGLVRAAPSTARRAAQKDAAVLEQLVPSLREGLATAPVDVSQYPGERRAQIQAAFHRWVVSFAAERPLSILCDNVHAADQASLGFLLGLAMQATTTRLSLISTTRTAAVPVDLDALRKLGEASERIELLPLGAAETQELTEASFGDVPNVNRFAEWLHLTAAGNPFYTLELSRYAVAKKIARYADGTWVLPPDLPRDAAPVENGLTGWTLRRLSSEARHAAEALSIHDGPLTLELCAVLASTAMGKRPIFSVLDELVCEGVLISHYAGFRFTRASVRAELFEGLDLEVKKKLHRTIADALLATERDDFKTVIGAGFHLMHAGEETRGADLLARRLARSATGLGSLAVDDDLHAAVPGLEVAYRVYRIQGRSPYARAPLLIALVGAGYYVDWRLADRYGDEALEVLSQTLGLTLASKLRPFLGGRLSLLIGVLFALLRFAFTRHKEMTFKELFVAFLSSVTQLVGISLIRLEAERARRYALATAPFRELGENLAPAGIGEYCHNLALFAENRLSLSRDGFLRTVARLKDEKHYYRSLSAEGRKLFLGGALYALGVLESFRDAGDVLHYAGELEAQGFRFYDIVAGRLRIAHHAYRGEMDLIPPYRERLDLHAIQYGSAWQVEIWSPAAMITAYSNTGDVSGIKMVADNLKGLSNELPRMRSLAQLADGTHALLRGDLKRAIEVLEALRDAGQLSAYPGCTSSLGTLATAYNQAGEYQKAKDLCEKVLAGIAEQERDFVVFTLKLELQLALSEAALGDMARAEARADALLEKYSHNRGSVTVAALHQTRARIALLAGDAPVFRRHIAAMGAAARATNNPSLIGQWKRLERKGTETAGRASDAPTILGHTANLATELAHDPRSAAVRAALDEATEIEEPVTQTVVAVRMSQTQPR